MRCHKKTKESGFFEGDSTETEIMTKALKRTKVFTTSGDGKRIIEYSPIENQSFSGHSEDEGKSFRLYVVYSVGNQPPKSYKTAVAHAVFHSPCSAYLGVARLSEPVLFLLIERRPSRNPNFILQLKYPR